MPADQLRAIVGGGAVWEGGAGDQIEGVTPAFVVRPADAAEVAATMTLASAEGWRVAPRGSGSRMGLGNAPAALDLVLDVSRLDRVVEHAAGDLVVTVQAGARLDRLQAELAAAGQMLALDPLDGGGTIGGLIATNASGPRRLRYGTVRDLLIGVTLVLADGTTARAGGRVVKNVAGYDLSKLMTGSLGTLGVIVEAVFRLHPLPAARRLVEVEPATPEAVGVAMRALAASTLVPAAAQLRWSSAGPPRLGVLFEGTELGVRSQAETAAAILGPAGRSEVTDGDALAERWSELTHWADEGDDPLSIKVTCLPARLAETMHAIHAGVGTGEGDWEVRGMAANGVLEVRLTGPGARRGAAIVDRLRAEVRPGGAVVLAAPRSIKQTLDVWGDVGDSLPLMHRLKDRFDPAHLLNPGRFVGGI